MAYKISEEWLVETTATISTYVNPEDYIDCESDDEVWDRLYDELYESGDWDGRNPDKAIEPIDGFKISPKFFEEIKELRKERGETEYVD